MILTKMFPFMTFGLTAQREHCINGSLLMKEGDRVTERKAKKEKKRKRKISALSRKKNRRK